MKRERFRLLLRAHQRQREAAVRTLPIWHACARAIDAGWPEMEAWELAGVLQSLLALTHRYSELHRAAKVSEITLSDLFKELPHHLEKIAVFGTLEWTRTAWCEFALVLTEVDAWWWIEQIHAARLALQAFVEKGYVPDDLLRHPDFVTELVTNVLDLDPDVVPRVVHRAVAAFCGPVLGVVK